MKKFLLSLILLPNFVFAVDIESQGNKLKSQVTEIEYAVDDYYKGSLGYVNDLLGAAGRNSNFKPLHRDVDCEPRRRPNLQECVDASCDLVGKFNCDDLSEIDRVQKACRGNYGKACIVATCNKVGKFGCDDLNEIERVGEMCRGQQNADCLDTACNYLGKFGCDDLSEVEKVNGLCAGWVDTDCIDSVCTRLGKFGCDDFNEIEQVVLGCKGH